MQDTWALFKFAGIIFDMAKLKVLTLQVLVATMHQEDYSLIDRMNISSDAVIVNQCNKNGFSVFNHNGHRIEWYDVTDRGASKSRSLALLKASADICILADDDEIFRPNYETDILEYYNNNPKIDVAVFNIQSIDDVKHRFFIKRIKKLGKHEILRYGAARISFKREAIVSKCVWFNLAFGPGSLHPFGEDTLFIAEAKRKGLTIYGLPLCIADIHDETSTWFEGYNEKHFVERGAFFRALSPHFYLFYILQYPFRHMAFVKDIGINRAIKAMISGARSEGKKKR